jgi:hypothetical protein
MAVTTNLDVPKRGGRISFTLDEPKLAEQFFGFTRFELGDDPHGPLMVVQVIPPDLEFATHYHDTDYCTLVLEGSLRVGRTWYRAGHFRVQDARSVYGPSRSGPEGCKVVSFYADRAELPDKFTRDADRQRFEDGMPALLAAYAAAGMGRRDVPAEGATVGGP